MKKQLLLCLVAYICSICAIAAPKDQISAVVSGQAPTKEEAVSAALRSAIEQSYGVFISSRTNIKNDILVSDEIVSISSGNIKKYTIISELNSGGVWSVTLNAVVSLSKLSNFMTKHGESCSFDGDALSNNIKLMQFRTVNTEKCLENLVSQLIPLSRDAFSFDVNKVENPIFFEFDERMAMYNYYKGRENCYYFPVTFSCFSNNISAGIKKLVLSTLKEISLSADTIKEYENFTGVTKIKEINVVLPGKQDEMVKSLKSILHKCLYGVVINGDGTDASKALIRWRREGFVHYDDRSKKEKVYYKDSGQFDYNWDRIYDSLKRSGEYSDYVFVRYPVFLSEHYDYYTSFRAEEISFENWGMKDKKNGQLVYKVTVFLDVPQDQLRSFTGVSVKRQ